ncbi:hypothetical protein PCL_07049 [Purpureocillium lilacinum]|uniref:Uncharacterized protein n=1 Tax=Purpureocillium lilacinum TaxID=33203 RepID=A0A2U3DT69_PURLI|nr:hypothetical protein PCL_07049 [Purpureocillium lilacinum]
METLPTIGYSHRLSFPASNWSDGLFRKFGPGLDTLVRHFQSILHIAKAAIMMYTLVLLVHGLYVCRRQDSAGLPRPAVDGKGGKKSARRVKLALPLGPFVSWHFTLKVSKGDRVLKTGVSLGPVKIMAVVTLGKNWTWKSAWKSLRPQAKLVARVAVGSTATTPLLNNIPLVTAAYTVSLTQTTPGSRPSEACLLSSGGRHTSVPALVVENSTSSVLQSGGRHTSVPAPGRGQQH